jgi:hypothetical protein
MKRAEYVVLFLAALLPLMVVANFQHAPGYMDADYYTLTGAQLAGGNGFSEPVLWNYLDQPLGLPHPSHAYWLPLPSMLAAGSMILSRAGDFASGRLPFILMAAGAAPLSAALAWKLTRRRELALLAGGLAALPGFYLPYLATIETFAPSILLGGLFFLIALNDSRTPQSFAVLGLLAGLMSLNRAEGLLWLLAAGYIAWRNGGRRRDAAWVLAGFLLNMAPWMLRNWLAFGSLLAPGAARTIWLTNYDDLFVFPATGLNYAAWIASGWGAILSARLSALAQNIGSAVVVQGLVVLAPLMLWGALLKAKQTAVRAGVGLWIAFILILSLVFPFSGARGGFFHALAGLQVLSWALAAVGLAAFVEWGTRQRGWNAGQALRIFSAAAIVLAAALGAYVSFNRLQTWNQGSAEYAAIGQRLAKLNVAEEAIVMVNNPPGFGLATNHRAIVIPNGGVEQALAAARQFAATILILESNHPTGWDEVYASPQTLSSIQYVESLDGAQIFFIP